MEKFNVTCRRFGQRLLPLCSRDNETADEKLKRAVELLINTDAHESEELLFEVIRESPASPIAHLGLGLALAWDERAMDLAERHFEQALSLSKLVPAGAGGGWQDEFRTIASEARSTLVALRRERSGRKETALKKRDEDKKKRLEHDKVLAEAIQSYSTDVWKWIDRDDWNRGEGASHVLNKTEAIDEVEKAILQGWMPKRPFIAKDMQITAFGSCFAAHITRYLNARRYNVGLESGGEGPVSAFNFSIREGMANTYTLAQQFEWAFGGEELRSDLWFDEDGNTVTASPEERELVKSVFHSTDVFIATLGLSEVWYDRTTEDVLMRCVPKRHLRDEKMGFRVTSVAENLRNLNKVRDCVRNALPDATIIFTLSPVRMRRSFRKISTMTANSVSKAILRVAVDELMREHPDDERLFYFPSYEIVTDFFTDSYEEDNTHPKPEIVDFVMRTFSDHFLVEG